MYTLKQIPSEAKIRKYLRVAIFGSSKLFCPRCHHSNPVVYEDRYRCRRCRVKFSLLSHTLSNMKLPLTQWWMVRFGAGRRRYRSCKTQALTHLSEKAVRHWYDQFRTHLPEEYHVLENIVQLDEACFRNWCLLTGKQIGSRKLAYDLIYQATPGRLQANKFEFTHTNLRTFIRHMYHHTFPRQNYSNLPSYIAKKHYCLYREGR